MKKRAFPRKFLTGDNLQYPLEWLDRLVTVSLDPAKINLETVKPEILNTILNRLKEEDEKLKLLIKTQAFSLNATDSSTLVQRYHSSLVKLVDQILENQRFLKKTELLNSIFNAIINCLDELLDFIETYFSDYLGLDERVPATYLATAKAEVAKKLEHLNQLIDDQQKARPLVKLVLRRLKRFASAEKHPFAVTFRMVFYDRELVGKLELLDWTKPHEACLALHELLIYMNFNSKGFIRLLTSEMTQIINTCTQPQEKMEKLLYFQKAFHQLHSKPHTVLNPKYHNLETVLKNWFTQEIAYLTSTTDLSKLPPAEEQKPRKDGKLAVIRQKVTCILSSDQMGLIIRGADESRVILAKSMTEVFKTLVPHLSSPFKEELSYDGMRSKSYVAEERDKKTAIAALEKIIRKIKGY